MQKLLKALEVETCKQITMVEFSDIVTYMLLISKNGTKHLFLTNCLFYVSTYCKKASVTIYALSTIFEVFFIICKILLGRTKDSVPGNFKTNL